MIPDNSHEMNAMSANVNNSRPLMACDNCRRRKVRCNRERPCQKCQEVSLLCQYNSVARRKGPKGRNAPVLASLRSLSQRPPSSVDGYSSLSATNCFPDVASPVASLNSSHCSVSTGDSGLDLLSDMPSPPPPQHQPLPIARRVSSTVLLTHVKLFLQNLYPIMPVFDASAALLDCGTPEILSPERYAFLVALSATAHLQLNLDEASRATAGPDVTGESLINEAVQTLQQFDPLQAPHTDSLLIFFFLFCANGNLGKEHYAWYYLSQSISFAYILNLNKEASYANLSQSDAETRRRMYWLLFITERAYALQTGRPVMLRGGIRKPSVFNSDSPAMLYGFVSLVSLFENMTPDFYDWNLLSAETSRDTASVSAIYQSIASFSLHLLAEISEIHQVDVLVTQQWLQARLWKFCVDRRLLRQGNGQGTLPIQIPATAGKSVMACLSSVSQQSTDAHGIGIEQKLYDVGESLAQLGHNMSPQTEESLKASTVDVKDLLCGILSSLSKIRGSQSYLFSSLLHQSQGLLGLDDVPQPLLLGPALSSDAADSDTYWNMLPDKATWNEHEAYQEDEA